MLKAALASFLGLMLAGALPCYADTANAVEAPRTVRPLSPEEEQTFQLPEGYRMGRNSGHAKHNNVPEGVSFHRLICAKEEKMVLRK